MLESVNPEHLSAEIDTYWVKFAGADPVEVLKRYTGRLPLVHIKVTSVKRVTTRPDLTQLLIDNECFSPNIPPSRWDLVLARRNGAVWRRGDAWVLSQYLEAKAAYL